MDKKEKGLKDKVTNEKTVVFSKELRNKFIEVIDGLNLTNLTHTQQRIGVELMPYVSDEDEMIKIIQDMKKFNSVSALVKGGGATYEEALSLENSSVTLSHAFSEGFGMKLNTNEDKHLLTISNSEINFSATWLLNSQNL